MSKIELLIFTHNNEVVLVTQSDDEHIQESLEKLIDYYLPKHISEFDSIEDVVLELHSLGVNTTVLKLDLSDLIKEDE